MRKWSGMLRPIGFAARALVRSPGFTLPALAILCAGMTAATAIFTVADSILFRPLDLPSPEALVIVCEDHARLAGLCIAAPGQVEDLRTTVGSLLDLGIGRSWAYALTDVTGSRGVNGGIATAGFLRALAVRPALGRFFAPDEVGEGRDRVVVLSHALWTTRYGADPSALGSKVILDGEAHTVVGVMPSGFEAPFDMGGVELWKPPHFDPLDPDVRDWRGFRAIGRLAPGVGLETARAELGAAYEGIAARWPAVVNDEWRLRVAPLRSVVVGDARPVLLAFLGGVGLLLLIVCANVANLVLARGLSRRRELAVRAALGATRRRLIRGILGESLVLTLAAAVAALALGRRATDLVVRIAPPEIPRLDEVALDLRVLAFVTALSVGTTAAFAVFPALRVTRWSLADAMSAGSRGAEGPATSRLRDVLVTAEVALAVVLLASAALLGRSFGAYLAWEPGFERDGVLTVSAFASPGRYPDRESLLGMWRRAEEAVGVVPGVVAVATASAGPLFGGGDGMTPWVVEGGSADGGTGAAGSRPVRWYDVGPGYFATLGVPVLEGREIQEADGLGVELVAVVNRTMARSAWPGVSTPVGRRIRLPELGDLTVSVVGVVPDLAPLVPGDAADPEIYFSNRQLGRLGTFFVVRGAGEGGAIARSVTEALLGVDPELSLGTPRTLVSLEERALVRPRFQALILLSFSLSALVLTVFGVYAVVSYNVTRRVREMGIRLALGAAPIDLLVAAVRANLVAVVVGLGVGLVGAVAAGRVLAGLAHGVSPTDPVSLLSSVAVLGLAAGLAALSPAWRAVRSDPLRAIHTE